MDVEQNLKRLGIELPEAPEPIAAYVPARRAGNLLYISGQLPLRVGKLLAIGPVPTPVSTELGQEAARQCAINALAIVKSWIGGDWAKLVGAVRLGVFVQSQPSFGGQPTVANGASELLQDVLGDAGCHARAAVGVTALPLNAAVEAEFIFELAE